MPTADDAPQVRRGRRWCQFRLADLLLATAIVAALVVIFEPQIERWLDWLRNLAAAQSAPVQPITDEATVVLKANGAISLDGQPLTVAQFPAALQAAFERLASDSKPPRVHIWCDRDVLYAELMSVVDMITQAGCTDISIDERPSSGASP